MCLGVPMEIVARNEFCGTAEVDGVRREVSLVLLPEPAGVGDFVLVHAGYAIGKLDPQEAAATLAVLRKAAAGEFLEWGREEPS